MNSELLKEFHVTAAMKENLRLKLQKYSEIFKFEDEPAFASLIAVLGLQFEIGKPEWDRFSPLLGVDLNIHSNKWQSQIVALNGMIGLRLWIEGVEEFYPQHPDFSQILHESSMVGEKLSQIVIFPQAIAHKYKKRGLELVIVRDWVLTAFLSANDTAPVNYLVTNEKEVEMNSAKHQAHLMKNNQVAFSGTHDLVDHLLGGNSAGFRENQILFDNAFELYEIVFNENSRPTTRQLNISYLVGVVLDDMAQPKWYSSKKHQTILIKALKLLEYSFKYSDHRSSHLDSSYENLVTSLRSQEPLSQDLDFRWNVFSSRFVSI